MNKQSSYFGLKSNQQIDTHISNILAGRKSKCSKNLYASECLADTSQSKGKHWKSPSRCVTVDIVNRQFATHDITQPNYTVNHKEIDMER